MTSATKHPHIVKLGRTNFVIPLTGLENLSAAQIWDVDPSVYPDAEFTDLAALMPDHYAEIVDPENPLLGRPVYFMRRRGRDDLVLYPVCDKEYWFRAVFRAPIKVGSAPPAKVDA